MLSDLGKRTSIGHQGRTKKDNKDLEGKMVHELLFDAIIWYRVRGFSQADIECQYSNTIKPVLCNPNGIPDSDFYETLNYYLQEIEDPKKLDVMRLDLTIKEVIELLSDKESGKVTKLTAARALVTILDRRSRLLGLDAPIKVDQTNTQVRYSIDGVDIKEITG